MNKILLSAALLATLSPVHVAHAVRTDPDEGLCGPATPGTCPVGRYMSFVKAFNECGFDKTCSADGTFAVFPSLECSFRPGRVSCDAWPQTWPGSLDHITYQWSVSGFLIRPTYLNTFTPSVDFTCTDLRGGRVTVRMRAPEGLNWVTMSVNVPCQYVTEP